jgi:CheY-like chemotaxis protein
MLTSAGQTVVEDPATGIARVLTKPVRQSRLLDAICAVVATEGDEPVPTGEGTSAARITDDSPQAGGIRVLVAEDQPVNWMLLQRLLAKRGYAADNAVHGNQVLTMLETTDYDLVFMDCQMPILDGYATSREVRRREAERGAGPTTIVAMTANAMPGDRERCLAAGMDDYLPKPVTSGTLDDVLARWLPARGRQQPAPLDPVRLDELRSLFSGEETAAMIRQLQSDVEGQLARIQSAIGERDLDLIRHAAHRILGSARMIGAGSLADAAARLQERGREAAGDGLEPLERSVGEQWQIVSKALDDWLMRLATGAPTRLQRSPAVR